jgi:hypothetical protein
VCVINREGPARRSWDKRARINLRKRMDAGTPLPKNKVFVAIQQVAAVTKPRTAFRERRNAIRLVE